MNDKAKSVSASQPDRMETEAALRASEAKFATAFGYSPLALTITSVADNRLIEVNEHFVELSGYSREEAIGKTPEELGLWVDPVIRSERFSRLRAGERVPIMEAKFRIKSGEILIGMIGSALMEINGELCVLSSVTDITEHKRSQIHASLLAEISKDLARWHDPAEVLPRVSEKIAKHIGLARCIFSEIEPVSGKIYVRFDWIHSNQNISEVRSPAEVISAETGELLKQGKCVAINQWIHAPYLSGGSLKFVLSGYASESREWRSDETDLFCELASRMSSFLDRADFEAKLRVYEERFRLLTENAKEYAIIFLDSERKVTGWNIGAERILGWTETEILGKSGDVIFLPEHRLRKDPETEIEKAVLEGRAANERWHLRKDGSRFYGSGEMIALYDDAQRLRGFAKLFRDLTERKQQEDRLTLLADISELTRTQTVVSELMGKVCTAVGKHLGVSRCLFNEIDVEKDREIVYSDYYNGVPSVSGIHKISDYSSITSAEIQTGKTIVNHDSKIDPRTVDDFEKVYSPNFERSYVAVPLFREKQWVGSFWVSDNHPRQWTRPEVSLIEEIAERTWSAVERLRIDRALRQSEERFRQAADAANALVYEIYLLKGETAVVYGMERVVGYSPDEAVLTSDWWHSLIHPEDLPSHLTQLEDTIQRAGKYVTEYRVRRKDGIYITVQDNGIVIPDETGSAVRLIGAITDITARKMAEGSLQQSRQQLQEALAAAEEAGRLKDQFLATVSHELRTPLNAILGWAHLLRLKQLEPDVADSASEAIYVSAKNQGQIIDDLLDVARIVSGKMMLNPQKIVLADVLSEALSTMAHAISAKSLRMDIQFSKGTETISFYADGQRLQQVFWNLLANAVKFTPAGGSIEIHVEQTASEVLIRFRDTGIGIPQDYLPFVFERFRQVDSSTTRQFGGLGLGLSITKHLIELHGGSISAESEGPGAGSTFCVRLPLIPVTAEATILPHMRSSADPSLYKMKLPGARIILVDDDENTLRLIERTFDPSGATLRTADSAEKALEICRTWNPELLISDIAMPDYDGYWLIQQLRQLPHAQVAHIPAVALTAYASPADRAKVLASGFQMFVPKPVEPAELLSAANALLQGQRNQPVDQPAVEPVKPVVSLLAGKRVLLVEDDLLTTEVLRHSMEREGMEFRSASKAAQALQIVQEWKPDMIVSDLGLPDEDGYELIKKIRSLSSPELAGLPAIALTGYGKEEGLRAVAAGFHVYKSKPIEPRALVELLNDLMKATI